MNFSNKNLVQHPVPDKWIIKKPIEYKKVDPQVFKDRGYSVEYIELPATDNYLSDKIIQQIQPDVENTVIANIGVGQGKSFAAQKLMLDYYNDGYTILIASPFKSLVAKDHLYLTHETHIPDSAIFNYNQLDEDKNIIADFSGGGRSEYFRDIASKRIHIITINSLLGNPGENAFLQSYGKTQYLNWIVGLCKDMKKKVVFFFDEIHETVSNFQNELMFLLRRWKEITHKCFILTATFTEPTYIVAMHIAYLTNDRIKIIEAPRTKNAPEKLAELELYFCKENYNSKSGFEELDYIAHFIESSKYERYHILSYSEKIAQRLKDLEVWKKKEMNFTVGSNRENINQNMSNVGTTFKTGINIKRPDALIIICPSQYGQYSVKSGAGIFYDGVPSIVQSFARLRNGGKIVVFLPPIKKFINTLTPNEKKAGKEQYTDYLKSCFPFLNDVQVTATNIGFEKQFSRINTIYDYMLERVEEEKQLHEKEKSPVGRPEIQFPTLDNFILTKGQSILVYSEEKYGKYVAPYIIWAAFHDQFQNCKLSCISTHEYQTIRFSGDSHNFITNIREYFETLNITDHDLREMPHYDALQFCLEKFRQVEKDGVTCNVECIINGKPRPRFYNSTQLTTWLINYLHSIHGLRSYVDKEAYIRGNIRIAQNYRGAANDLVDAYKELGKLGSAFISGVIDACRSNGDQKVSLPKRSYRIFRKTVFDFLNAERLNRLKVTLRCIKSMDKLIKPRKFSVLQKLDFDKMNNTEDLNELYSFFKAVFLKTTPKRIGSKNFDVVDLNRIRLPKPVILDFITG